MSDDLSAQRDRIQRQVEELERSLAVTQNELDLLSSETGTCLGCWVLVTRCGPVLTLCVCPQMMDQEVRTRWDR